MILICYNCIRKFGSCPFDLNSYSTKFIKGFYGCDFMAFGYIRNKSKITRKVKSSQKLYELPLLPKRDLLIVLP